MVDLAAEEAAGGHTIAKHVGRTEQELRQRLANELRLTHASSFVDLAEAEEAVAATLAARADAVAVWEARRSARGAARVLILDHTMSQPVGRVVARNSGQLASTSHVRVVLRKTARSDDGWIVLTAYPTA